jgi:hypothetical protein
MRPRRCSGRDFEHAGQYDSAEHSGAGDLRGRDSEPEEGRVPGWRGVRPGCCDLPHWTWLERSGIHSLAGGSFGFQIGGQATDLVLVAVNDHGFQDLAEEQVQDWRRCGGFGWSGGPEFAGGYGLEDERELLTYSRSKGCLRGSI